MSKRKQPTKDEKLAAALLALDHLRCKADPALAARINREKMKKMSSKEAAKAVQSVFDFDHDPVPVYFGGDNHPTNLKPKPRPQHREKTAKKDIKDIAKSRRILAKAADSPATKKTPRFTPTKSEIEAVLPNAIVPEGKTKSKTKGRTPSRWGSRPMPGTKKSGWKKHVGGKVTKRSQQP